MTSLDVLPASVDSDSDMVSEFDPFALLDPSPCFANPHLDHAMGEPLLNDSSDSVNVTRHSSAVGVSHSEMAFANGSPVAVNIHSDAMSMSPPLALLDPSPLLANSDSNVAFREVP